MISAILLHGLHDKCLGLAQSINHLQGAAHLMAGGSLTCRAGESHVIMRRGRGLSEGRGADLCMAAQTVSGKPSGSKALESFCRDLCQQACDKSIDVVSGTNTSPQYTCLPLSEHHPALLPRQERRRRDITGHRGSYARPMCIHQSGALCGR